MEMAILIGGVIAAVAAVGLYLHVQERDLKQDALEQNVAEEATEEETVTEAPGKKRSATVSLRRIVFLCVMLLSLCAMTVALEWVYPGNTLVDNGKLLTLLAILFAAASVDARQRIIPNMLVLAGIALRVAFWIIELVTVPNEFWSIMKNDLTACLLVAGFFVIGVLLVKGGIGMGDIKLMLVMGLFQGFYGVVGSLFCSLFVAFVYAIVVLILRKKTKKDSVAFAPAILIGTIISVFLTGM